MKNESDSRLECAGCGAIPPRAAPFRCAARTAGDDVDHVIARRLEGPAPALLLDGDDNPYVRFRRSFHSYHTARKHGLSDEQYVGIAERLDRAIATVDDRGFHFTPLAAPPALGSAIDALRGGGGHTTVWAKVEVDNVSGSHKGRHLMAPLLHLEVMEALGWLDPDRTRLPLAVASCGNAALAAAVLARAARRPLQVFVPPDAPSAVMARLMDLGAELVVCSRDTHAAGDPCYLGFQAALGRGAMPLSCQGPDNGMAVEGGQTLGYELAVQLAQAGAAPPDRIFVQVGGGAFGSAVVHALREAVAAGRLSRMPIIHAVQTQNTHPLWRAWQAVQRHYDGGSISAFMAQARRHRSAFMRPWDAAPQSLASGILDDETYDWAVLVEGMLETGGSPVLIEEEQIARATAMAREATGMPVCPTGASGWAGALAWAASAPPATNHESIAVVFTGRDRGLARGNLHT